VVSSSCLPFFDCKSDCKKRANGRVQPRCGAQRSNVGCNGVGPPAHLRTPDGISRVSVCICQHPAFYLLTPSLLPRERHWWSVMLSPAPRWSPYQFDALGCAVEHAGLRMEPPWGFHHESSCDRIRTEYGPIPTLAWNGRVSTGPPPAVVSWPKWLPKSALYPCQSLLKRTRHRPARGIPRV